MNITFTSVASAAPCRGNAAPVTVELAMNDQRPAGLRVHGTAGTIREQRDRVRAAVLNSGLRWPEGAMVLSFVPPGVTEPAASLDLPVALAALAVSGQLDPSTLEGLSAFGELGLDGSLRPVPNAIALLHALPAGDVVLPAATAAEVPAAPNHTIRPAGRLAEVAAALNGGQPWPQPPAPGRHTPYGHDPGSTTPVA